MAPLIIATLYGLMFLLLKVLVLLEMSSEARLAFNIIGGIGALILPLVIYSLIDSKLTRRVINATGKSWCYKNNVEFNKVENHKNHFALIYEESGKKVRKKFRVNFIPTTWLIKSVEWL